LQILFVPVKDRFRNFIKYLMFLYFLSTTALQGQILKDTASINLLKNGVDDIYDFRFDEAREVSRKLNRSFPGHPVVDLLNGMITYWENYPLIPSSPASISYENYMRSCIRLCEENYYPDDYAEKLLANLGARGMLLEYFADNNLSEEVFPVAKSTYRYLRQSFDYTSFYPDFYFFTGLYNYYREAYPDAHPVYKLLAMFFPKGDRIKGLMELQTAAKNSIMLKAESFSFLSLIYISFENNYQQAYTFSKSLHELYPANIEYLGVYIKNMLLVKKYDEAENLIRLSAGKTDNSYFQGQLAVFNGILQEKKYNNNALAQKYYNKGINDMSVYGYYGNEYAAFAYFGLSRISDINGDRQNKKTYRKKAMELTNYKSVNFD
jgi:hypothetical protein